MRKRATKKCLMTVIIILVVVGMGVGTFFGVKAIYNTGVGDGRKTEAEEVAESVQALGRALQEKIDFQDKLAQVFGELPSEINTEGIDKYIEKLNELINQTTNEEIKSILNDYMAKWQELKTTYETQDNDKITESFNALKVYAADTAAKIKTTYDEAIKTAISNL